ncbi:MlaD family protein [Defluviimonas sp. D31]|uniref:MlaD family protein n=1 Tax=Defluviimonas sp. D31 TaxID=3083253 RepID=UPI00296FB328|nr:MlaD family protein [Defluviimonas sp. D31]MDW4549268.1 MlaD family protein [Defluviimonas sp. D31]
METRANYVLIGAFALAGFFGLLVFFLWFARVELDRQFAYYDIDFPTVSGLSNASEVRFSGFPVGQVVEVALAPDGSGQIRVRIEVAAETPVRTGSIATIESQGVTGVSYVGLSAGDPREPLLQEGTAEDVPRIAAGRSVLQSLSQDAPEIVEEVLAVARQLREILGPDNQGRITAILTNLEGSSENLGQVLEDFSAVTGTVAAASEQIASFADRLDPMAAAATTALETADGTLKRVGDLAVRAEETLAVAERALESGRRALNTTNAFIAGDLPRLIGDLNETTARLREQVDLVGADARAMMKDLRGTAGVASARLAEVEVTIAATDAMLVRMTEALDAFYSASESFDTLVKGEGTALVADTRAMLANAERVIASATAVAETDLPAIVESIRGATQTAARVVEEVGADLSSAAGRIDGLSESAATTLATVTETFTQANETLAQLNGAIETGDRALAAADRAFTSADRIMGDEVQAIVADLRATLGRLDKAMAQVSADLPVITSELRSTAERANVAIGQFQDAVRATAPPVGDFAREGLPQYTRLARETRALVENLDQLVRRIERDPARYLLGRDAPEFRR